MKTLEILQKIAEKTKYCADNFLTKEDVRHSGFIFTNYGAVAFIHKGEKKLFSILVKNDDLIAEISLNLINDDLLIEIEKSLDELIFKNASEQLVKNKHILTEYHKRELAKINEM